MKELDKKDVVVNDVDGNAVDALSADLANVVASQTDSAEEIQLSLDKKEKELDDSKQVDAEEGVDVVAADSGLAAMIMAESTSSTGQGGGGASADGGLSTNGKLLTAAGVVAAAGIAVAASDGGGGGGGGSNPDTDGGTTDPDPLPTPEKFTLKEAVTAAETIEVEPITKTITYIGFNPHGHDGSGVDNEVGSPGNANNLTNEGPLDGGIPLYDLDANFNPVLPGQGSTGQVVQKGLMSYITDLTGVDFVQLGLINVANGNDGGTGGANSTDLFPDLSDITLTNNGDGTQTITVVLSDGTENTAEVQISEQYFTLLTNLLFDSENNLRLYEQEVTFYPQVPVTVDGVTFYQNLYEYESGGGVRMPIILTTTTNNGGTEEAGLTSAGDDLIEVGRLDLLHGAYIDGGAGVNTLEIDAKGFYAQPKELLNIQNISIENLPNVYTNGPDSDDSTYPDLDPSFTDRYTNSIIDLSRAGELESLTISESNFQGLDGDGVNLTASAGDLTVAGIRGTTTLTLDGAFSGNNYSFHFRDTPDEGVNLVLHNVNFDDGNLILAHNSPTLNLASTGASNVLEGTDLSGDGANSANLTTLNITGAGSLFISESIADAFAEGTPAVIDASANTGGVDLNMNGFTDELIFTGTAEADDHLQAISSNGRGVTITGGNGDNEFDVESNGDITVTAGNGDNEVKALSLADDSSGSSGGNDLEGVVTVALGDGNNNITVAGSDFFTITAGDGNNRVEALTLPDGSGITDVDLSTIVLGDGQNEVLASSQLLSITAGNGGNEIEAISLDLNLISGTGNDVIAANVSSGGLPGSANIQISGGDNSIQLAGFEEVNVTTAAGDDSLTIEGGNINFGDNNTELDGADGSENGEETLIVIDLGAGNNTLTLGIDNTNGVGVTAVDGSSITGQNITLVVNNDSDLSRADISGITAVQMGDSDVLTLTVTQFLEMGGSTAFSSIGSSFGAHSVINLVVDQNTSLDALGVDDLPRSFDFSFEVMDGVRLDMTAQQLHERVINQGVTAFVDANGDFAEGSVYITGGGPNFNENDATKGGSIHVMGQNSLNVFVSETVNGYDRPADVVYFTRINVDTDTDLVGGVLNPFTTNNTFLRITGDAGLTFVPVAGGVDEWGQPIPNAGDSILLGDTDGNGIASLSDAEFLIDFSTVVGVVEGLTFDNFNNVTAIYGNGDARVDVKLLADVATDEQGLVSQGVSTFVVVDADGDYTFWTCETTQDLEILGMQGMFGDVVTFGNTERGVDFLMEVEYSKTEGYVVGTLNGLFARPGAAAVVNVVGLMALPDGETQIVAGINLENAAGVTVNVVGGNTEIQSFSSDNGSNATLSLTINADADLVFPQLSSDLESADASGVDGVLTTSIDAASGDAGLDFVGAASGTNLTIVNAGVDAIDSIGGAGPIALTIGDGASTDSVDLTETTLTNVTSVSLSNGSELALTFEQADVIGAANFAVAEGDSADLMLVGLSDQVFSLASYDVDGTLDISLTLAALPVVTLNPLTDLTGIDGLVIPEGTTLFLTMAQFQQLNGDGELTGLGSVVITDVTQASVGEKGADLDMDDVDLGPDSTVTLVLSESVDLSDADIYSNFNSDPRVDAFEIGGFELTLGDIQNADGVAVTGDAGSILKFTDISTNPFETIDASGFDVDFLYYTNTITNGGNRNIDDIFAGLSGDIEKVSYFGEGYVVAIDQVATIQETVTVTDSLTFNPSSPDVELNSLTLNMQGGTEIAGNLRVSTGDKWDDVDGDGVFDGDEFELVRSYLRELTINSNGTDQENLLSGVAANVITGDITPNSFIGGQNNNLLSLTINASQDFILEGDVILNSNVGGDGDNFASNDIENATATITTTGTADVTLGGIDSSDGDVVAVVVNNIGTGNVFVTLDDNDIDADDSLSFTGSNINLTIEGDFDLSDDDLSGVSSITLTNFADVVLSFAQVQSIGIANITGTATIGDNATAGNESEDLVINGYDGSAFDFSAIDAEIEDVDLVMAPGAIVLDPTVNLTGVTSITVPEGGTLSLTAAQFQQLEGIGTIVGVDGDGNPTNDFTVNITGLTQADIDNGPLDLSDIEAANATLSLAENVELSDDDILDLGSPGEVEVLLADTQQLGLATFDQADGLDVTGTGDTDVFFRFNDNDGNPVTFGTTLDASGYNVTQLHALNVFVGGFNVEFLLDDLAGAVELVIYYDPEELGMLNTTNRVVIVEEGVSVGNNTTALAFNDLDAGDEVITLTLNLMGGVELNGDIVIGGQTPPADTLPLWLQNVTIVSEGDGTVPNALTGETNNVFDGDLTPFPVGAAPGLENNNLLDVDIVANLDFDMTGHIYLNRRTADDSDTATVSVTGPAAVSIKSIDTAGSDTVIDTLSISNTGGPLTITAGSDALQLDGTENLIFLGDGDILLDTDTTMSVADNGVDGGDELSNIDASGFSGALTLNVVENIDAANFTFTTGSGVTTATFTDGDLSSTAPGQNGWAFDYSNAAAGSELHLAGPLSGATAGSELNINMGPNGVLFIDATMDLSDLALVIQGAQSIVLADDVVLTLTAAQADGLNIIAGDDIGGDGFDGVVNIVNLTNDTDPDDPSDAFDLSGISADVAGTITLAGAPDHDDVTLDKATDLGFFSVTLDDLNGDNSSLGGQTIRFQTVDQAERAILVNDTGSAASSSANVVWLFTDNLGGVPINTDDYSAILGRLFVLADFVDANGGDIEDTFTTLPNTILRVPADDLNEVNVLLQSNSINRTIEIEHFETVGDLIFDDSGISPEEHIQSVTLLLGGQVTVGNIVIDDVFGANVDPASVSFDGVTINSQRAVTTGDLLANEDYVNDNDGINEVVSPGVNENVQPNNMNTVGNISVGGGAAEIDLLTVTLNTGALTVIGDSSPGQGADLTVGNIVFDSEVAASTATLVLEGANKITAGTIDWSDTDITTFTMDVGGFTGTFDPVLNAGTVGEVFTIEDVGGTAGVGTIIYDDVTGDELSVIDASGSDENITMTISNIDGSDDLMNDAFTYSASTGINTITVDGATLGDGGVWHFDFTGAVDPESTLTITDGTVFTPTSDPLDPTTLRLTNVNLVIEGDVDFSQITLDITGGTIVVPAGQTLHLTVEQLEAAGFPDVTGEGTVVVTGDASDIDTVGTHLQTVNVDLTAVTLPTDADGVFTLTFVGATSDDGMDTDLGQSILTSPTQQVNITTGLGGDTVNGSDQDDVFTTDGGDDVVTAGAGNDLIDTDGGADTVDAGDGDDTVLSGGGNDVVNGGIGNDIIISGAGDDTVDGGDGDDIIDTDGGADFILGGIGNDTISGGAANDTIDGGAGDDVIDGDGDDDIINGGAGLDTLMGSAGDDVITGGADDDAMTGGAGSDTFNVDAGTDTITDLSGDAGVTQDDVLVVSAGATAIAETDGFIATADTVNDGTATITGAIGAPVTIDVSLAGGANGFTLVGNADDMSTLIGSEQSDVISDGDVIVPGLNTVDALTGNGGSDTFTFAVNVSNTAQFVFATTTPAIDRELITITAADDETDSDETVSVTYTLDGVNSTANILVPAASMTSAAAIAAAVITALDARVGISAVVGTNPEDIVVSGDNGSAVEITAVTITDNDATNPATAIFGDGVDQAQVSTLTVNGTPTAGDIYSISAPGEVAAADYTALMGDTNEDVAAGLAASFNAIAGATTIDAVAATNVITFTDEEDDNGGFTIAVDSTAAFGGSSATGDIMDYTTLDYITDFTTGEDFVSFGLLAGAGNYAEGAAVADYTAALAAANAAFDTSLMYYMTSATDLDGMGVGGDVAGEEGAGILFVDANLDGTADIAVLMLGVDNTLFQATDIVA